MRFLADESCDFSVVRALRSADHDVVAIAEISPREEDPSVMNAPLEKAGFSLQRIKISVNWSTRGYKERAELFLFVSRRVRDGVFPPLLWNWSDGAGKVS